MCSIGDLRGIRWSIASFEKKWTEPILYMYKWAKKDYRACTEFSHRQAVSSPWVTEECSINFLESDFARFNDLWDCSVRADKIKVKQE